MHCTSWSTISDYLYLRIWEYDKGGFRLREAAKKSSSNNGHAIKGRAGEPEPGVFGSLEPEPLEKKQEPEPLAKTVRSRSRSL